MDWLIGCWAGFMATGAVRLLTGAVLSPAVNISSDTLFPSRSIPHFHLDSDPSPFLHICVLFFSTVSKYTMERSTMKIPTFRMTSFLCFFFRINSIRPNHAQLFPLARTSRSSFMDEALLVTKNVMKFSPLFWSYRHSNTGTHMTFYFRRVRLFLNEKKNEGNQTEIIKM